MLSILCKKNPVHYLLTYSFEIHLNLLPHACHILHLSPFSNFINQIIVIDKQNLDHHYHYHQHQHLNTIFLPSSLYYSSMCSPSPIWTMYRSQRPRVLRCRSSAARLLRFWVRIPPGACMFVCCECYVLSGRGLCDWLITRPDESYRLWRVVVCDQKPSKNEETKASYRAVKIQPQWVVTPGKQTNNLTK
jgi:hypothetical protein